MPKGTVKQEIRNLIFNENEILWKTEPKLRQSKLMLNDIQQKTKKSIINSSRKTIRKIIAIATGHNTLGYHMKNKGYEDDAWHSSLVAGAIRDSTRHASWPRL